MKLSKNNYYGFWFFKLTNMASWF